MISISTARNAYPSSRMRAPSLTSAQTQRSTISSAVIWRCVMLAAVTHLRTNSATSGSELLCQLHASGDHFFAGCLTAYDFEQAHDVRRAEKMCADHAFGPRSGRCDFVNIERGRVARQNRARPAHTNDLAEDLLLERHALEHGLDNHVDRCEALIVRCRLDQAEAFINELLREAATFDRTGVVLPDGCKPAIKGRLVHLFKQHGEAGVGENHGDAAQIGRAHV